MSTSLAPLLSAGTSGEKGCVAAAIVEVSEVCPACGVQFTLYRREVARSLAGRPRSRPLKGSPGFFLPASASRDAFSSMACA
jgi:hypothetical protein